MNTQRCPTLSLKDRITLSIFSGAVASSCRRDFTMNRRIWKFFDFKVPPETPRNGIKTSDVIIDPKTNLWFRLYTPDAAAGVDSRMPVVIFMHGGGFSFFGADSAVVDMCCERLARNLNVIIASINYRLAPENKCPTQYEDCVDAVKFIDENTKKYLPPSADPKRCFLLGDSAGGNLIHHVTVRLSKYELKALEIKGLVSIQPFFGGEERTESETGIHGSYVLNLNLTDWFWKAFLPECSDRDHPAANVFGPNSDDISSIKFSATLLVIGGLDILQDWQRRYCEGMKKSGKEVRLVEYPNAIHGFWGIHELPEYSLLMKEIKDFMQNLS